MLSFECILCSLALVRGLRMFKSTGSFSFCESGFQLLEILLRDSVIYFMAIGATYFTCMMFWVLAPPAFWQIPVGFSGVFPSVLANRMVLNIRKANARDLILDDTRV
ncbi:hypothetical protein GALMADRAFT_232638 [Galerina marginata CBS 339.88]|uniref:Uncharacterized protein n=1 Tax=Galerina marginata (strain CBS 339.88) TaxID=685588 RepID=A0A067SHM7_GALM3|nr:hypothetical protein GALMADRAFT_232638 [Galerina marginata CBS 339.88]